MCYTDLDSTGRFGRVKAADTAANDGAANTLAFPDERYRRKTEAYNDGEISSEKEGSG
jgi:hypothetical protein